MMTQTIYQSRLLLKKLAAIIVLTLLSSTLIFCQKTDFLTGDGWWTPIFKRHSIDLNRYNYKNTIDFGSKDTTQFTIEIGNSDSLNNRNVYYKNGLLIFKSFGQTYTIVNFEDANHDFDNSKLTLRNGKMSRYDPNDQSLSPIEINSFSEMLIDIGHNRSTIVSSSK